MAGEIIQIPLSNCFRFVLQAPAALVVAGDPDYQLLEDQEYPGVFGGCYSQKVNIGDVRVVHIRSNYSANVAKLFTAAGAQQGATINFTKVIDLITDGGTYDIWEASIDFTSVPAGKYYLVLSGTGTGLDAWQATSEPIDVRTSHPGTLLLEYYNFEPAFQLDYRTGVTNYIRVEGRCFKQLNPTDTKAKLNDLQQLVKLKSVVKRQRLLETFVLPGWLHEKIAMILEHDVPTINGVRYTSVEPYAYEMEDDDLLCSGSCKVQQYDFYQVNRHDSNVRQILPAAPTTLAATAVSSSQIDLTWVDNSNNEDGFQIEQSADGVSGWTLIHTTAADAESYSVTGLTPDTEYFYRVRAVAAGPTTSSYTNIASATTFAVFEFTTYWNTGTDGNLALAMTGLPSTARWIFSDDSVLVGSSIDTNKALLNGSDQLIRVEGDFSLVTDIAWPRKRLKGALDFEYFTGLTSLNLGQFNLNGTTQITSVDIVNCNALTSIQLMCSNDLTAITWPSANSNYMTLVHVGGTGIGNAAVAGLANFTGGFADLRVYNSSFAGIPTFDTLTLNPAMANKDATTVTINSSGLTTLDLNAFNNITELRLYATNLATVTNWPNIVTLLDIQDTNLTSIPTTSWSTLTILSVRGTPLTSLDIDHLNLQQIYFITTSALTFLDLSGSTDLTNCQFGTSVIEEIIWPVITDHKVTIQGSSEVLDSAGMATFDNLSGGFNHVLLYAPAITTNIFAAALTNPDVTSTNIGLDICLGVVALDLSMFEDIATLQLHRANIGGSLVETITWGANTRVYYAFNGSECPITAATITAALGTELVALTNIISNNAFTEADIDGFISAIDTNKANWAAGAKTWKMDRSTGGSNAVPSAGAIATMTALAASHDWTFTYWNGSGSTVIT